ncbi:calcium/sodium antiporter [candidate division KSB3 bacterium]|uniref:Calcium/sodium antiporter n=1 Tax=candidate division KSB3 bacterium TaxID=2044937 RepID=A0A9D5Q8N8_9BACT|nr:calcium/sodium antiporter [candidate division KSB3 bacterium]MBD3327552.1 calcium/sodium antiporter [candidate division KSB3 bacterium]
MHLVFWIIWAVALIAEGYRPLRDFVHQHHALTVKSLKTFLKTSPQVGGLVVVLGCTVLSFNLAQALLGIILLIRAADVLISGAEVVAAKARIPPIVIGVLIIGLGTSTPEFFVNAISALQGNTDIAFGNIVGSNICNMGLVIGIAGWLSGKIQIEKSIITAEIPVMMASTLLIIFQVMDWPSLTDTTIAPNLSRQDGLVMLLGMGMYLLYTFHVIADVPPNPDVQHKYQERYGQQDEMRTWVKAVAQIVIGIVGLYFGGDFTVTGATAIAVGLGAGTLVVGVIIGIGTSLPELATAISSVLKNQTDLVIGNVVGSNIFNILLILGTTAMIQPIYLTDGIAAHLGFLLFATTIFFIALGTKKELNRLEAILLTCLGVGYLAYSIITG